MAHATNEQEMLLQNLKDAGCSQQMIESCVTLFQQKKHFGNEAAACGT